MSKKSCEKWKLNPTSVSEKKFKKMKQECKSDKFDEYDCTFFKLTSINPQSMRKISSESGKKKISNKCNQNKRKQLTLEDVCKKWIKDPFVNPRTGRKLSSEKSKVYKSLEKECKKKSSPKKSPVKKSQKKEEKLKRDLEPFEEVKKQIMKLEKNLNKCQEEEELDDWELEFDNVHKQKDLLVANTHELEDFKKDLTDRLVELFELYEEKQYECEKRKRRRRK